MPMTAIIPPGAGKPLAPYSPGVMADNIVYVSGTLPLDRDTNVVHVGDAAAQTRHVLEGIKSVIEAAGGTMAGRDQQLDLHHGLGELRRHQRGVCRVFSRRQARAVLHPVWPGQAGGVGGDRHDRPLGQGLSQAHAIRDPAASHARRTDNPAVFRFGRGRSLLGAAAWRVAGSGFASSPTTRPARAETRKRSLTSTASGTWRMRCWRSWQRRTRRAVTSSGMPLAAWWGWISPPGRRSGCSH